MSEIRQFQYRIKTINDENKDLTIHKFYNDLDVSK